MEVKCSCLGDGVGEEQAGEAGLDHGQEGGHSAICHHGRDQVGSLAEVLAGGCSALIPGVCGAHGTDTLDTGLIHGLHLGIGAHS
jgi:hypothetical protein